MCGISALAWLAGQAAAEPPSSGVASVLSVIAAGGRSTSLVSDAGEGWRLLTCHFVHTSLAHLVFNLAFLFPVGGALEQVLSRRDFVALLLASAAGSSLASLIGTPQVSAGASGLVFAVLGAAVAVGVRHGPRLPDRVRLHFGVWVLPFLLIVLAVSTSNPGVDHFCHAGGLLTGLLMGAALPLDGDQPPAVLRPLLATGATAMLLTLAPAIAARGQAAVRVPIDDGATLSVPAGWRARFGPVGELQFTSAGGLVVLAADRSPAGSWMERQSWYTRHRLASMAVAGRVDGLTRGRPRAVTTPQTSGSVVRYAFERGGIAMVRDVFFLAPQTVVSLELPRAWASKYDETRDAIVGSVHPAEPKPQSHDHGKQWTVAASARP
ncbi:MAG: rhomboid family intramembrane serine protease [Myxococcota bacterium]